MTLISSAKPSVGFVQRYVMVIVVRTTIIGEMIVDDTRRQGTRLGATAI